jgi:hypothetical protein
LDKVLSPQINFSRGVVAAEQSKLAALAGVAKTKKPKSMYCVERIVSLAMGFPSCSV